MSWIKHKDYANVFYVTRQFNHCTYVVSITVEDSVKSLKFWVAASSGKKRKDLVVFEEKESKSDGGLKALIWIKNQMLNFPQYYKEKYNTKDTNLYICISWSDSRRRNIYERLLEDGFKFQIIHNNKTLIKKV